MKSKILSNKFIQFFLFLILIQYRINRKLLKNQNSFISSSNRHVTERTRDSVGDLLFNGSVFTRAAHPELRLQNGTARHNARRKFSVTIGTVGAPLIYMCATLGTIASQSRLLVFWCVSSNETINLRLSTI